jgi:quercetin dioxygenase-like cupin family protein
MNTLHTMTTSSRPTKITRRAISLATPAGVVTVWKTKAAAWLKIAYTLLLYPFILLCTGILFLAAFAAFLPPVDMSVGVRSDRTLMAPDGEYSVTFLKTGHETNGEYELIRVELEPGGGNPWHYHKTFDEQFTVLDGQVLIGKNGEEFLLAEGETLTAAREEPHFFKNPTGEKATLLVKTSPAGGLEKSIRVGYGLASDGLLVDDMPQNFWHLPLVMAYSQSYFTVIPAAIQEALFISLAKIAQWKGEDRELYKYFK